jgi:hypothetical protein
MNVELVAQMFKNYQSNVLFHLEGWWWMLRLIELDWTKLTTPTATDSLKQPS